MMAPMGPLAGEVLQLRESRGRVAELVEVYAHAIHQRQVQAAQLPVVVALREVVEHAAALDRAAALARDENRQLTRAVRVAVEEARCAHEDRVVEQRRVAL